MLSIFATSKDRMSASDELQAHRISRFILFPKFWANFSNPSPFRWKRIRFDPSNAKDVPNDKLGVYSFVAEPGLASHPCSYLLYVGKTERNFRHRFKEYLKERTNPKGRPLVQEMLIRWDGYLYFYYAPLSDAATTGQAEKDLLLAYLPPMNDTIAAEVDKARKGAFK